MPNNYEISKISHNLLNIKYLRLYIYIYILLIFNVLHRTVGFFPMFNGGAVRQGAWLFVFNRI